jgi:hypothetical protein
MSMTPSPNELAGSGTEGSYVPFQLFAGEKDVTTDHGNVAINTTLPKYQVIAFDTSGNIVKHAPAASDSTNKAIGVLAQPIVTGSTVASAPYYTAGFFNHDALVWAAATDTLAERKAAFVGTEIQIGTLYGAA